MSDSIRIYPDWADDAEPLRPESITIFINGRPAVAHPGETVATALLAAGVSSFYASISGAPRAPVCNMGVCFECVVTIDGLPGTRSCMTLVAPNMHIESS